MSSLSRYYQRRGLVPQPVRPRGGVRRYSQDDAERLRCWRSAHAAPAAQRASLQWRSCA
ncbi:MAG TPA: MerR family transcriptional regulator [Steroidobacteraceae bacterium]|nr:MerR family transcriptional regulator [Steroidobacteraceae bacterium]